MHWQLAHRGDVAQLPSRQKKGICLCEEVTALLLEQLLKHCKQHAFITNNCISMMMLPLMQNLIPFGASLEPKLSLTKPAAEIDLTF